MFCHVSHDLVSQLSGVHFQIINDCNSQNESSFFPTITYVYHSINLGKIGAIFASCVIF